MNQNVSKKFNNIIHAGQKKGVDCVDGSLSAFLLIGD